MAIQSAAVGALAVLLVGLSVCTTSYAQQAVYDGTFRAVINISVKSQLQASDIRCRVIIYGVDFVDPNIYGTYNLAEVLRISDQIMYTQTKEVTATAVDATKAKCTVDIPYRWFLTSGKAGWRRQVDVFSPNENSRVSVSTSLSPTLANPPFAMPGNGTVTTVTFARTI